MDGDAPTAGKAGGSEEDGMDNPVDSQNTCITELLAMSSAQQDDDSDEDSDSDSDSD
jgi:hypothetical protein